MTESASFLAAAWALSRSCLRSSGRPVATAARRARRAIARRVRRRAAVRRALRRLVAGLVGAGLWRASATPLRATRRDGSGRRSACSRSECSRFLARPLVTGRRPASRSARTGSSGAATTRYRSRSGSLYHLADLELYLAVVPLAVAPIVLWRMSRAGALGREARGGIRAALRRRRTSPASSSPRRSRALPWGTTGSTTGMSSTSLPLWLIAFVVWLADGLPRPLVATRDRRRTRARAAGRSCRSASSPTRRASTPFPARSGSGSRSSDRRAGDRLRRAAARRYSWSHCSARRFSSRDGSGSSFPSRCSRSSRHARPRLGADDRTRPRTPSSPAASSVPGSTPPSRRTPSVTKLYIESTALRTSAITRHALFLTEFFNDDRRPRRVHRRLGSRRAPDRARRRRRRTARSSSRRATRSSPTTSSRSPGSSSTASRSRPERTRTRPLATSDGPVRVVGRCSRTTTCERVDCA